MRKPPGPILPAHAVYSVSVWVVGGVHKGRGTAHYYPPECSQGRERVLKRPLQFPSNGELPPVKSMIF